MPSLKNLTVICIPHKYYKNIKLRISYILFHRAISQHKYCCDCKLSQKLQFGTTVHTMLKESKPTVRPTTVL